MLKLHSVSLVLKEPPEWCCGTETWAKNLWLLLYPWIPRAVIEELSSQRRNEKLLKIGDSPETRETELNMLQRLRNKGARKRKERSRARHTAQTANERQATSQWKSTCEHGADEERKFSDTALWRRRWRCDGITFNFYTGLPHIYFSIHSFIPVLSLPKKDWI